MTDADAELRRRLLDWYAGARRDLPWRRTRDPYAIWVSEAMLQQTRVALVAPYWERFLARFPDVAALAGAADDDLLAAWSGLGYYRRARSLRAAARRIRDEHGGRFPRSADALRALPGIGPYTAGAVLSIAFDAPEPLVDGNVARVLSRLFALDAPPESAAAKRALWTLAARLVPEPGPERDRGPGAWNQALMELGALVCAPREPRCDACPVRASCAALAAGLTAQLPRPARRAEPLDVALDVLLVVAAGRVLALRRPETGRMAGLFECPTRERGSAFLWPADFAAGARLAAGAELGALTHGITRHRIRARVLAGSVSGPVRAPYAWLDPRAARGHGWTGMSRKLLARPFARAALDLASGAGTR